MSSLMRHGGHLSFSRRNEMLTELAECTYRKSARFQGFYGPYKPLYCISRLPTSRLFLCPVDLCVNSDLLVISQRRQVLQDEPLLHGRAQRCQVIV